MFRFIVSSPKRKITRRSFALKAENLFHVFVIKSILIVSILYNFFPPVDAARRWFKNCFSVKLIHIEVNFSCIQS